MGLFKRISDVVTDTSRLMIETNSRFETAVGKIAANTYTADDWTKDVTSTALQTFLLWLKFWRPLGDETLPTIMVTAPASSIPGATGLNGTGSLVEPVPPGTALTVTDLAFLGWVPATATPVPDVSQIPPLQMESPIPANKMDALGQRITVTLQVPAAAPVPQRGIYEGYVLRGDVPVAVIKGRVL